MGKGWGKGSTTAWRRTRALVLLTNRAEHGGACQIGLAGVCTGVADCVHHTHGRATTGDDPRYLVAACTPCNLKVGDPTKAPDPPGRSATRW